MNPIDVSHRPHVALFGYTKTMTGYEVIDNATGRPMGFERETAQQANGIAQRLNEAARNGRLARALRAS